ncbi:MAG TPA: hypothetical protein PK129_10010, partial [Cellvibrionaceae bacterium]|nr:hypothetical protein [Cellvibrionaceae bacterium]
MRCSIYCDKSQKLNGSFHMASPGSISFAPHQHIQAVDYFSLRKRLLCASVLVCSDLLALTLSAVACQFVTHHAIGASWVFWGLVVCYFVLATSLGHYFKRLPYWDEYRHLGLFC